MPSSPFSTSAISGEPPREAAPTPVGQPSAKIALLLPQAGFGPNAVMAKGMKQAVELALFEKNNPNIQLIVKDDRGTAAGAEAAATEAINEGAEFIIGPLLSPAVPGAAQAARARGVSVLALSNDTKVAGGGVFLMSFIAEQDTQRIVSHAAAVGKRRFAALIPDTPYGDAVEPAFRAAVQGSGGTIVALERYRPDANQMLEPVKRVLAVAKGDPALGAEAADALFLPGGHELMNQMGPLINYAGIDTARVQLIGTGLWDYPSIGRDSVFVGGWYPAPDSVAFADFSQRFARTFGSTPPRLATLGYDAMNIALTLAAEPKPGRYAAAALARPSGFAGVDGTVRFAANGLPERALAIHQIQPFGSTIISPAIGPLGAAAIPSPQVSGPAALPWARQPPQAAGAGLAAATPPPAPPPYVPPVESSPAPPPPIQPVSGGTYNPAPEPAPLVVAPVEQAPLDPVR